MSNIIRLYLIDCGPLRLSINNSEETTYVPKNSTHFGSVALIKCKVGYSFSNGNTSGTFICSEKATWNSNVSITCLPVCKYILKVAIVFIQMNACLDCMK
jgi:hypothetical protein